MLMVLVVLALLSVIGMFLLVLGIAIDYSGNGEKAVGCMQAILVGGFVIIVGLIGIGMSG